MILGVSLLHLEHVFESIDKQSKIDNTLYVKENVKQLMRGTNTLFNCHV